MPGVIPPDIDKAAQSGAPAPPVSPPTRRRAYERLKFVYAKGIAYGYQLGLRPQTLYGMADSPVGLAAYLLDHDARSYGCIAALFAGQPFGDITRDDILDNITLYWLTNTAISSAPPLLGEQVRLLRRQGRLRPGRRERFPDELYQAPRSWSERAYPKLIHYNKLDKGGHFAAWEEPKLLF